MSWLEKTTTWLERTDARVGISTDGTVRSGRHAGEMCLRSKQELLRRGRLGRASTVKGVYSGVS